MAIIVLSFYLLNQIGFCAEKWQISIISHMNDNFPETLRDALDHETKPINLSITFSHLRCQISLIFHLQCVILVRRQSSAVNRKKIHLRVVYEGDRK